MHHFIILNSVTSSFTQHHFTCAFFLYFLILYNFCFHQNPCIIQIIYLFLILQCEHIFPLFSFLKPSHITFLGFFKNSWNFSPINFCYTYMWIFIIIPMNNFVSITLLACIFSGLTIGMEANNNFDQAMLSLNHNYNHRIMLYPSGKRSGTHTLTEPKTP